VFPKTDEPGIPDGQPLRTENRGRKRHLWNPKSGPNPDRQSLKSINISQESKIFVN
jgi:hypothetical protein